MGAHVGDAAKNMNEAPTIGAPAGIDPAGCRDYSGDWALALGLLCILPITSGVYAQAGDGDQPFTYQGELVLNGAVVNAVCAMAFSLHDARSSQHRRPCRATSPTYDFHPPLCCQAA